jgi:hypothetical protein
VFATTYLSSSQFVKLLSSELRKEIKVRSAIKEIEMII